MLKFNLSAVCRYFIPRKGNETIKYFRKCVFLSQIQSNFTFSSQNKIKNPQSIDIDVGLKSADFGTKLNTRQEVNILEFKEKLDTANKAFSELEYEKAATLYREILEYSSTHFPDQNETKEKLMIKIGQSFLFLNHPEESARYLIGALEIVLKIYGKTHLRTAQILALIGNLNFMCNRLDHALNNFGESLKIYDNANDAPYQEKASLLKLIGNVQEKLKNYQNALESYLQALKYYEKNLEAYPLQVYEIRKDIAKIYLKIPDYQKAYDQYTICIKLAEKYLERDPLGLADIEERCGEICLKLQKFVPAADHFEKASKLIAEKVGEGDMKVTELSIKAANIRTEAK